MREHFAKANILALAKSGAPKPTRDYQHYDTYIQSMRNPILAAEILAINPSWKPTPATPEATRSKLLALAKSGAPKPTKSGPHYNVYKKIMKC